MLVGDGIKPLIALTTGLGLAFSGVSLLAQVAVATDAVGYVNLVERFGSFGLWAVVVLAWIFKLYPAQRKAEEDRETARVKTAENHADQVKLLIETKDQLAVNLTEKLTAAHDKTITNFLKQLSDKDAMIDRMNQSFGTNLDKERSLTEKIADMFHDRMLEKLESLSDGGRNA